MFGLMGVARMSGQPGGAFSPLSLFANGEQGLWYDPSDFSSMFQDSAGTTPVTAVGQPVGLILDKRFGLALGPELVTNATDWDDADLDDTPNDWLLDGAGILSTVTGNGFSGAAKRLEAFGGGYQALRFAGLAALGASVIGKSYQFTLTYRASGAIVNAWAGLGYDFTIPANTGAAATFSQVLSPTVAFNAWALRFIPANYTDAWFEIDNVSVREIAGNHASQPTAAARPVVSARVNLLTKTEDLDVADWYTPGTVTVETAIYTAPDSSVSGIRITALGFNSGISGGFTGPAARHTGSFFVRAGSTSALRFGINDGGWLAATATIVSGSGSITGSDLFSLSGLDSNWTEVRLVTDANIPASAPRLYFYPGPDTQANGDSIGVWHPQVETGSTATAYQRVTTATDYDTVGFPHYLVFDGIDDCLTVPAISITTDMTVVRGFGRGGVAVNSIGLGNSSANTPHAGWWINDNTSGIALGASTAYTISPSTETGRFVDTAVRSAIAQSLRRNAAVILTGAAPTVSGAFDIIGRAGNNGSNGPIFGLIAIDRELAGAELAATEAYIASKSGVTL